MLYGTEHVLRSIKNYMKNKYKKKNNINYKI